MQSEVKTTKEIIAEIIIALVEIFSLLIKASVFKTFVSM